MVCQIKGAIMEYMLIVNGNWIQRKSLGSASGTNCLSCAEVVAVWTTPSGVFTLIAPLNVHVCARSRCFWSKRAVENSFARIAVRSSLMYNLVSLSSLYSFKFFRILSTRSRSVLLTNLTMIGLGWFGGAFRRVGRRWLTLISLSSSGGSTPRISLAILTTACVVSSCSFETPLMRRLCLRPCCSRASWASLRCCTSDCRAAI